MKGKVSWMIKALLVSYVVSCILLLILAFGVYKLDLKEQIVQGGIIVIYALSAFFGGRTAGKLYESRRIVWGGVLGVFYYVLLFILGVVMYQDVKSVGDIIPVLGTCVISGMIGGVTS